MSKQRGFTLIELLVVMSISAILMALAAPSFKRLLQANQIGSAVNTFMADARFARSEAVRLGGSVVMCRSDLPEAVNPACGTGSGPGTNGWVSGWIIFQDLNNNGNRNTTDPILRVQSAINTVDSIADAGTSTKLVFTATGRLKNLSSATQWQFGSNNNFTSDLQRVVCVSLGGRVRIAGDGTAACGSSG